MEIDRKELKRQAKEAMGLTNPRFWLVALVYILMTDGVSTLVSAFLPSGSIYSLGLFALFSAILISLYTMVVRFGYDLWSLWTCRRLDPGMGSLLQGFSVVGRVIWMEILISLRITGWSLLLSLLVAPFSVLSPGMAVFAILAAVIAVQFLTLRYALAPYLLADHPNDGAAAAVRRSTWLMNGWTWEFFKLELSFFGWVVVEILLALLVMVGLFWFSGGFQHLFTGNVSLLYVQLTAMYQSLPFTLLSLLVNLPLLLWLLPYRSVTRAGFYEARLRYQQENAPTL